MNPWIGYSDKSKNTFGDAAWEAEQRKLVSRAIQCGWIRLAATIVSTPVSKRASAANVARKKRLARPKK